METQRNRNNQNDLKKDSATEKRSQDSQRKTPEASGKKNTEERSQGLREDRESQVERDASKHTAPKQPRK